MTEATVRDQIDKPHLRAVLGRFVTGVVVVTANTPDGRPTGMTANSFSSLSLDPPMVLFCVSRRSRMYEVFAAADAFAVNVLRERDRAISQRFARPGLDRFGDIEPRYGRTGVPILDDPLAVIECAEPRRITAGDHDVVIGRVTAVSAAPELDAAPLVYYAGGYRTLGTDPLDWWAAFR